MTRNRLAEFIRERLDEDEAEARRREERDTARYGGVPVYRNLPESPERIRREVESKRCALAMWEDTLQMPGLKTDPMQHHLEHLMRTTVILPLAAIYADHPDYCREWRVFARPEDHPSDRRHREEQALQQLVPLNQQLIDRLGL